MSSQGGKGGKQESTTNQLANSYTNLPGWLDAGSQQAIGMATDLSNKQYNPYTGQLVADQSPDTLAAYQQVRNLQGNADPAFAASANAYQGLLGQATPQTADQITGLANQLYGNFGQQVLNPAQSMFGSYAANAGPATAGQVGANAQALMSPYSASVIAPMIAAGEQQREMARQQIAKSADSAGAFGGSRQGVVEGTSDAAIQLGTQQQIGNLLQSGWGQALTPATNLATSASAQGFNANNILAQLGLTGYQGAQTEAGHIGDQNLAAGLTAADRLPAQAVAQGTFDQQQAGALQAAGGGQQAYQQQLLNSLYGQYQQGQNQPYQNLDTLLAALGAVPYGTTSGSQGYGKSTNQTYPGLMDQISGAIGLVGKVATTAAAV